VQEDRSVTVRTLLDRLLRMAAALVCLEGAKIAPSQGNRIFGRAMLEVVTEEMEETAMSEFVEGSGKLREAFAPHPDVAGPLNAIVDALDRAVAGLRRALRAFPPISASHAIAISDLLGEIAALASGNASDPVVDCRRIVEIMEPPGEGRDLALSRLWPNEVITSQDQPPEGSAPVNLATWMAMRCLLALQRLRTIVVQLPQEE
jgi:hypothetical protein